MARSRRPILPLLLCLCLSCAHELSHGRTWVHDIRFKGNQSFSGGDLREGLATEKTGWWPFASKKWFDPAMLDVDLERLRAFYADHGYFDVQILAHEAKPRGDGSVDVTIELDEGKPTQIETVRLEGLPPAEEAKIEKLTGRLKLKGGERFDYQSYAAAKKLVESKLHADGYAYAKVSGNARVDRDDHKATLELETDPGPLVRFGDVKVVGNGSVPRHAILSKVTWEKGDRFDPDDLGTTQGRLYNLGVFGSVKLDLPQKPQDVADVTIQLTPGKLHELRFGAGVGVERERNEVRGRAEWSLHNFLGGLRTLRLRIRPAFVAIPDAFDPKRSGFAADNDIQLTQPDLFSTEITGHALAGYDLGISEGFQYYGPRAQLGLDRPFFHDHVLAGASWNLQYLNFFDIDTAVFDPARTTLGFGFKNPYRLAYLEEFAQLDLRDRPLDARSGAFLLLRTEEGLPEVGGDFTYFKLTPEVRGYVSLGRRVVLAARGLWGWLEPSGVEDSPVTRRFALGGPSSHRGFGFGRLAPQVLNPLDMRLVPVGGDAEVLLSAEARIEVTRLWGNWLGVVPFLDAGDVTPRVGQIDLGNLHYATGLSLDYQTPIGVARVGVGVRLNRLDPLGPNGIMNPDPGERFAFHLTIGEAF